MVDLRERTAALDDVDLDGPDLEDLDDLDDLGDRDD